jgi:hypothetical protein
MDSRLPASQPYRILLPQGTQPPTIKASIESLDHVTSPTKVLPDWVTIYPHVWHMYRVKGFKLREIMTHMEYIYGFKATYVINYLTGVSMLTSFVESKCTRNSLRNGGLQREPGAKRQPQDLGFRQNRCDATIWSHTRE